jgi:hypothetical protein
MQLTERHLCDRATHNQSNWYFVQPTLSGTAGVIIGLAFAKRGLPFANFLGWI